MARAIAGPAIRIGFLAAGVDRPITAETVAALEESGADSLWAAGHVASGRPVPEAITGVAHLAALTRRVTVGTAVLLAPLYHPVLIAKQFAQMDGATGGRMALGVGVGGEYPGEFEACGVPLAERGPRTDEAIEVIRSLWAGGPVTREGGWWPLRDVEILPPPCRSSGPPILVAGRKAPAMRRAARLGDGWLPFLYSPRAYAEAKAAIEDYASADGRSLDAFEWLCFIYARVDDDRSESRRRALAFVGAGQAGNPARFDAVLDRMSAIGTPDDVAAALQGFVDAGARHLILACCTSEDLLGQAARIMTEVVPRIQPRTN